MLPEASGVVLGGLAEMSDNSSGDGCFGLIVMFLAALLLVYMGACVARQGWEQGHPPVKAEATRRNRG